MEMEDKAVEGNELKADWQDNVNIGEQHAENSQEILDMLVEFQHMWDGWLGGIDMARHCIELALQMCAWSTLPRTALDQSR